MRRHIVGCVLVGLFGCKFPELPLIDETGDGGGPDADLNNPQPLMVSVMGEGSVSSDPAGITCGTTCMADFDPLSTVMLNATPAATSVFEEWSGDCSGAGTCSLTMDGAKSVSARFALHGAVRWVNHVTFVENESLDAMVVDGQGNVIVAGAVEPAGERDLFVAKYSPTNGQVVWMRHFATPSPGGYESAFGGMALDAAGDIYVATSLQGNGTAVTYDPGKTAIGDLFHNIVVLRLSGTDGAVVWVKQWGGGSVDVPKAIAVSGTDVYVTGTTSSNPSTFDGRTIAGQVNQAFLVRASTATGTVAEARAIPGAFSTMAANGNNVLLGGTMSGTLNDGGTCGTSATASGTDGLVMMFAGTTLGCQWVKNFGSITAGEDTIVYSVASFANGDWAVGGTFEGSISGLTPTGLGSMGLFDAFAIRFALDGTHQWSFRYGGAASEAVRDIATTPQDNVLLAGNFDGSITFGAHTVMGTNNVFVTRMSSAAVPTHEWAVSLGGAESDSPTAVTAAPDGSVFVNATFSGMTTVGATPLAAQGIDAWVAGLVR